MPDTTTITTIPSIFHEELADEVIQLFFWLADDTQTFYQGEWTHGASVLLSSYQSSLALEVTQEEYEFFAEYLSAQGYTPEEIRRGKFTRDGADLRSSSIPSLYEYVNNGVELKMCDCCGEEHPAYRLRLVVNTPEDSLPEYVCPQCIEENDELHRCASCNDVFLHLMPLVTADGIVCDTCATQYRACTDCGTFIREGSTINDPNEYLCGSCADSRYARCGRCHTYHDPSVMVMSGINRICPECAIRERARVCGYHSQNKAVQMYGEGDVHVGLELEVENSGGRIENDDMCYKLYTSAEPGVLFFEDDGSLRTGFEMITAPMTVDYFRSEFPVETLLAKLRNNGYRSHNTTTCGLHIHVSRSAFGRYRSMQNYTIAKLMLMYELCWDDIETVSRRDPSRLRDWAGKYDCKTMDGCDDIVSNGYRERYRAVNLSPSATVEFRAFRGTLNAKTLRASVELTVALIERARAMEPEDIQQHDTLRAMLGTHITPTLDEYLTQRGL